MCPNFPNLSFSTATWKHHKTSCQVVTRRLRPSASGSRRLGSKPKMSQVSRDGFFGSIWMIFDLSGHFKMENDEPRNYRTRVACFQWFHLSLRFGVDDVTNQGAPKAQALTVTNFRVAVLNLSRCDQPHVACIQDPLFKSLTSWHALSPSQTTNFEKKTYTFNQPQRIQY